MPCFISFSLVIEDSKGLWMFHQEPCFISLSLVIEDSKRLWMFRQMPCSISFSLVVEDLKGLWMFRQMPCSVFLITVFRRFNCIFCLSTYQLLNTWLTYLLTCQLVNYSQLFYFLTIVCSRSGPIEMMPIRVSRYCSKKLT